MKNLKAARRYAGALMQVAAHRDLLEKIHDDLQKVQSTIEQSTEFRQFLHNPIIKEPQKRETLRTLFDGKVGDATLEFLMTLCIKHRENLLPEIIEAFGQYRDEVLNLIPVEVSSVVELHPEQVEVITGKLKTLTGKTPRLSFRTDPALIGGVQIRIGDTVIDGSVRHQLDRLQGRLEEVFMH
jgi:F-type H+-transporting ATPase subunit delta